MPYMISSQSVFDGISKKKLVYSCLIFVDNKLTLICLLTAFSAVGWAAGRASGL